ncbi:MAG TPA: succinate dehydrogenase iron-sulfur subunit [Myxococcales bacterium]|jgi:succinate dehydrogenase / fumarate reductase iron-sulfur subunit|nr:succinate dehydrogenase iron-sulfur subunit [Myxococcales bacterium]
MADHDSSKTIRLRIKRQQSPGCEPRWEEFAIAYKEGMNVISCLMEIQRNPVTASGEKTTPVAWEAACLEEVCGACTMRINGRVRQACAVLVDTLEQPVILEPMTKFPVVRDLAVDRQTLFDSLKRLRCWIPIDGTYDLGPGPRQSPEDQQAMYVLSTCMTCGSCLEACPQVNEATGFIGAAPIAQVRLFNLHPTGKMHAGSRLRELIAGGGIQNCGKAQNCSAVCPKHIPLSSSIASMARAATFHALKEFFHKDE